MNEEGKFLYPPTISPEVFAMQRELNTRIQSAFGCSDMLLVKNKRSRTVVAIEHMLDQAKFFFVRLRRAALR